MSQLAPEIHPKPIAGYSSQERNVGLNSDETVEETKHALKREDRIFIGNIAQIDSDKRCISEAPKVERELTHVSLSVSALL